MTRTATLARAADRAACRPGFLGHALDGYCHRHGVTLADLATRLNVDSRGLARLRLCRRPVTPEGIAQVARYTGADAAVLVAILCYTEWRSVRRGSDGARESRCSAYSIERLESGGASDHAAKRIDVETAWRGSSLLTLAGRFNRRGSRGRRSFFLSVENARRSAGGRPTAGLRRAPRRLGHRCTIVAEVGTPMNTIDVRSVGRPPPAPGSTRTTFRPTGPHAWLQWKGTEVCMDVRCQCGAVYHVDAKFTYYVRCTLCERVWYMNPCIEMVELTPEEAAESHQRACVDMDDADRWQ